MKNGNQPNEDKSTNKTFSKNDSSENLSKVKGAVLAEARKGLAPPKMSLTGPKQSGGDQDSDTKPKK